MNQHYYRQLISGQKEGAAAKSLRFLLSAAALPYSTAVRLRNYLYNKGWKQPHRCSAFVVSVGNITAGGTGKTPLVIWLCKLLQQKKVNFAILTRGYKSKPQKQPTEEKGDDIRTDEPAIIAENCPSAKVLVNPDRISSAEEAVAKLGAEVLLMDDGFQHRRLYRDIDIVTIDATEPFGYGKLLPAGLLREPVGGLRRADAAVLTRSDQVTEQRLEKIEGEIKAIKNNIIIAKSIHAPVCVKYSDGTQGTIEELKSKKIYAFCGIGNPDSFLQTLKSINCNPAGFDIYNDHYHYKDEDIKAIYTKAKELKADSIITTQKDWSRIQNLFAKSNLSCELRTGYLQVEIKIIEGENELRRLIEKGLESKISK